jgi:hypothetical protein
MESDMKLKHKQSYFEQDTTDKRVVNGSHTSLLKKRVMMSPVKIQETDLFEQDIYVRKP